MSQRQVDPATVSVWRWQAVLIVVIMTVVVLVPSLILGGWWLLLPPAFLVLALSLGWWLAGAAYRNLSYAVDELGIAIHRGIFWHSHISLPRARIQHSDVSQGPLQRRYGVSTLKLYTAGSSYTKIELPGLAHEDAMALRDALLGRDGSGV
jgi:uncharacterized protein